MFTPSVSSDHLFQDVRHALRMLGKNPRFTAAAVTILALGIAVNAAVFTVTNAVLFKGFRSIDGNDRIVYIGTQNNGRGCCVSYPDFEDWRAQATSFDGIGAVADLRVTLSDPHGFPEIYSATQISANGFQVLGRTPIVGRDFSSSDETPGAPPVAILSYGFWQRRYERDPAVVGRTIRINGVPTTIISVMPQGFAFPQNQELWLPLVPTPALQKREARGLWFAFGRMAEGITLASARAEMEAIGSRLASAYPQTNKGWVPRPLTFAEFFVGPNAVTIYGTIWGAAGFVLLIACANLANLMLSRAIGRTREMSLRLALGAGRWQIVRQLLIESVMLSALGSVLGWWLATWGVRAYELSANPPTRSWSDQLLDYSMDARVLGYLVAMAIATALLFGLIPALRLSKLDVNTALRAGGRSATGGRGTHLSRLLVIAEMALAVVLLAGAGVMIRSFLNMHTAQVGVNTADTLAMSLNLPEARYSGGDAYIAFFDGLTARLHAMPGVESVALASAAPTVGSPRRAYELADAPPVDEQRRPTLSALVISPGYFRTLGAQLLAGRDFTDFDRGSASPAVIVNQQFARMYWPGEDPLGKRLRLFDGQTPTAWLTVVGLVSNIAQNDAGRVRQEFDPLMYLPYRQDPARAMWVFVRTRGPIDGIETAFRREIQMLDPELPVWQGPFALDDFLAGMGSYWKTGSEAVLFSTFAAIALLLASIGLYAVIAHAVSQRTQEIGIRLAIGGTASDILKLVIVQGMVPVVTGLAVGLAAAVAVNRLLAAELVRVSPTDPTTLIVTSVALIASATLGCLIPARRAMRVDPVVALRRE